MEQGTHIWKATKRYKNEKLVSFKYAGLRCHPVKDHSGRETDENGNTYIGSDVCDNCELEKWCTAFNPINNACGEHDKFETRWIGSENKNKNDREWIPKRKDVDFFGIVDIENLFKLL